MKPQKNTIQPIGRYSDTQTCLGSHRACPQVDYAEASAYKTIGQVKRSAQSGRKLCQYRILEVCS